MPKLGEPLSRKKKKCTFCKYFLGVQFILKFFPQLSPNQLDLWSLIWVLICVNKFSRKKLKITKHFKTAWTFFFLNPGERYKCFWYILRNQKVYLMSSFPSSPTYQAGQQQDWQYFIKLPSNLPDFRKIKIKLTDILNFSLHQF